MCLKEIQDEPSGPEVGRPGEAGSILGRAGRGMAMRSSAPFAGLVEGPETEDSRNEPSTVPR